MAPDSRPFLSVVIPTRNRRAVLEEALSSLAHTQYPREAFEVIVSDDGSTDGTSALVGEMVARLPYRLVPVSLPGKGIPSARNAGAAAAKGEILVFTDDDCRFPPDWLDVMAGGFDDPAIGALGVFDRAPEDSPLFARCVDYTVNSLVGSGGVRHDRSVRLASYLPRGFGMAVSRRAFSAVGGFDQTLEAGEDIDLSFRIRQAGYRLRFEPGTFVWHRRRSDAEAFLRQMVTRGRTRIELIRRHPQMLEPAFLIPAAMLLWFGLLSLFSWISHTMAWLLAASLGIYASALLITGWRGAKHLNNNRAMGLIAAITALQHLGYGYGTLKECFRWGRQLVAKSFDP